jgi:hypothetical protein
MRPVALALVQCAALVSPPMKTQLPDSLKPDSLNLDDETTVETWIAHFGTLRGRRLANLLGFTGTGAVSRANALSNYAWNKSTAISCRKRGDIATAQSYEAICDRIFKDDIGEAERW